MRLTKDLEDRWELSDLTMQADGIYYKELSGIRSLACISERRQQTKARNN